MNTTNLESGQVKLRKLHWSCLRGIRLKLAVRGCSRAAYEHTSTRTWLSPAAKTSSSIAGSMDRSVSHDSSHECLRYERRDSLVGVEIVVVKGSLEQRDEDVGRRVRYKAGCSISGPRVLLRARENAHSIASARKLLPKDRSLEKGV